MERADKRTNGGRERQIDLCVDKWMKEWMDVGKNGKKDKLIDRWAD